MTRTEARVRKQREIDKNTIIFPAEYDPRGPNVNAIVKIHEHVLQNNTLLKELFPANSFIVTNERSKNVRELVARADPYTVTRNMDVNVTLAITFFLRKHSFHVFLQELNLRFAEIALVIRKVFYILSIL